MFWINLDRAKERREHMVKELKRFEGVHTRVPAIDATALAANTSAWVEWGAEQATSKEIEYIGSPTPVKLLACTLSHLTAVRAALRSGHEVALIAEGMCTCI